MRFCESLKERCLNAAPSSAWRPPVCFCPSRRFWGGGVALEGCAGCPQVPAGGGTQASGSLTQVLLLDLAERLGEFLTANGLAPTASLCRATISPHLEE